MTGKTIAHYKILAEIGRGGMGVVYKAEDTKLKRTVALKFLPPHLTGDPEAKARFTTEAQAASALDHPNICNIHQIDETDDGQMFIVMAYYEGETLREAVSKGHYSVNSSSSSSSGKGTEKIAEQETSYSPPGRGQGWVSSAKDSRDRCIEIAEAIEIAGQVAAGLACAHEAGIVHRDIKPANIFITKQGVVKILDFGMAKLAGQNLTKTPQSGAHGTVAYMSPEQAQARPTDQRTDIWSLGVMLYEMLTGEQPFKGEFDQVVMYAIVNDEPGSISELIPNLPEPLAQLVQACLQKDLYARPCHCNALLENLEAIIREYDLTSDGLFQSKRLGGQATAVQISPSTRHFYKSSGVSSQKIPVANATQTDEFQSEIKTMLVVLPFLNLGDPADEYFADGITEEITAKLAGISDLGVIARKSAFFYKNSEKSVERIGEELSVQYILEGSIRWQKQKDGSSTIRVTPQLIRIADGTTVWADNYETALDEIFEVQKRIAEKVSQVLDLTLFGSEHAHLRSSATDNLNAYDYFLRGKEYFANRLEKRDAQIAAQMFRSATEIDGNFPQAYAYLAQTRLWLYWQHRDFDALSEAETALRKARNLAPDYIETQIAASYHSYYAERNFDKAIELAKKALQLAPSNAELLALLGALYRRKGEYQDNIRYLQRALRLDPANHFLLYALGTTHLRLRAYAEAEKYLDQAISLAPQVAKYHNNKGLSVLMRTGEVEKALECVEAARGKVSEKWLQHSYVWYEIRTGRFESALKRVSHKVYAKAEFHFWRAKIYAFLNDREKMLSHAQNARKHFAIRKTIQPDLRIAILDALIGRKQEAMRFVEQAEVFFANDKYMLAVVRRDIAEVYTLLGEFDRAIDHLKYVLSVPSTTSIPLVKIDPRWDALRDKARFRRMVN